MKFFLSHRSKDKDLVEPVYHALGSGQCHYDIATFDPLNTISESIYKALNESSHYILFASDEALDNETWVHGELKAAENLLMQGKFEKAIVFLLNGVSHDKVANKSSVLANYVAMEYPSCGHIVNRILSEVDELNLKKNKTPKLHRDSEEEKLAEIITQESAKLPKAIMVCGADGYGRKQLINNVYRTYYSGIPLRKFYINMKEYESDFNVYRALIQLDKLISPREVQDLCDKYESMPPSERYEMLAHIICDLTKGQQALIVESHDGFSSEDGNLIGWLEQTINFLPREGVPKLILISVRNIYVNSKQIDSVFRLSLSPINRVKSRLLLSWWVSYFQVSHLVTNNIENILDYVEGNNRLIKIAADLVKENGSYHGAIDKIYKDLESSASNLIRMEGKTDEKVLIAFIAECGSIDLTDLIASLNMGQERVNSALKYLTEFGLLIYDSISYRVPTFLSRTAKSFYHEQEIKAIIDVAIKKISQIINESTISYDSDVTIQLLDTRTEIAYRVGDGSVVENYLKNGVTASLSYRSARKYYDDGDYHQAYEKCERAFIKRPQLTDEGIIETLRIQGLAAARIGDEDRFNDVVSKINTCKDSIKLQRIKYFIEGFNYRLSGYYDKALDNFLRAFDKKGDGDYHVLRELSNIYLLIGDPDSSEKYIKLSQSKPYMKNNIFLLDISIRNQLSKGSAYVKCYEENIRGDIIKLRRNDGAGFAMLNDIELEIVLADKSSAFRLLNEIDEDKGSSHALLKARALMKAGKFSQAENILSELKKNIFKNKSGQRRSIFPVVLEYLIEAMSVRSFDDAIDLYGDNLKYIPKRKQGEIKRFLVGGLPSDIRLSNERKKILGLI